MIKELLYKMFRLEPTPCPVCEVLREQLHKSERERSELLQRALAPPSSVVESAKTPTEEMTPIKPQFIPWRVRQQMLEQEDRVKARLTKDRVEEIAALEKELGVGNEAQTGKIVVK